MAKETKLSSFKWSRILFFWTIFITGLSQQAYSLEMGWFGTSSISISDGETLIFTDPFFNRPSLWSVLFARKIGTNYELTKKYLDQFKPHKNKVILISHTHYDHILDLPSVLKIWPNATVIGPRETPFFTLNEKMNFISANKGEAVTIGKFTIQPYDGDHNPLIFDYQFAHGKMTSPISDGSNAHDYLADKCFTYTIETENQSVLFHPGDTDKGVKFNKEFDILFVGAQGRHEPKSYFKFLKTLGATEKTAIIPVHHDNFFRPLSEPMEVMPLFSYKKVESYLKTTPLRFNTKIAPYKGIIQ
ncbi:MAG: MBL fold metallo-hydrolase [Bdellovibrionota bacterium]|nr:MBL fold metallo-hydrolase [Bdellovibrionota bacterium]